MLQQFPIELPPSAWIGIGLGVAAFVAAIFLWRVLRRRKARGLGVPADLTIALDCSASLARPPADRRLSSTTSPSAWRP